MGKILLTVFLFILMPSVVIAQTALIGDLEVGSAYSEGDLIHWKCCEWTADASGDANQCQIYFKRANVSSGTVGCAVYSNSSNYPGTLLASGCSVIDFSVLSNGDLMTITLDEDSSNDITSGSNYWICAWDDTSQNLWIRRGDEAHDKRNEGDDDGTVCSPPPGSSFLDEGLISGTYGVQIQDSGGGTTTSSSSSSTTTTAVTIEGVNITGVSIQ